MPVEEMGPAQPTLAKAPLSRRFVAGVLDWFLVCLLNFALYFVGFVIGLLHSFAGKVLLFLASLYVLYWYLVKDGRPNGQSPGKITNRLQVVDIYDNRPCTKLQSAIRNGIWLLLACIPVIGWLIEPIVLIVDERGRRIGDYIAGTQVVACEAYSLHKTPEPEDSSAKSVTTLPDASEASDVYVSREK